jgi:hypothetical protein
MLHMLGPIIRARGRLSNDWSFSDDRTMTFLPAVKGAAFDDMIIQTHRASKHASYARSHYQRSWFVPSDFQTIGVWSLESYVIPHDLFSSVDQQ